MAGPRSDDDVAEAVCRLIGALGRRCASGDPDSAVYLMVIQDRLRDAFRDAVAGWREHGFTDRDIGRELGITRQGVEKRWPRGNLRLPPNRR